MDSCQTQNERGQMKRNDVLSDDVLLGIFNSYIDMSLSYGGKRGIEAWQSLVHVCRQWRSLVFGSPRHLNLRLYCTVKTPARNTLGVWPALPLIVSCGTMTSSGLDNVIVALGQHNRVCQVDLHPTTFCNCELEEALGAMQVPFPELTDLCLSSLPACVSRPPVIPDSFLGGSASRLRNFTLKNVPFRGLSNLLSSANNLVHLRLLDIPCYQFMSPEAMGVYLSVFFSLRILCLEFETHTAFVWDSQVPPPKRSILPALDNFRFKGKVGYFEKLVTFIDAPQLNEMRIFFFSELNFDCPRFAQFINRTPTLRACDKAHVKFGSSRPRRTSVPLLFPLYTTLEIEILSRVPRGQFLSITEACTSIVYPARDGIGYTRWLQILLPFTAVRNICLTKEYAPGIMTALQEPRVVGDRITEPLPRLQNIFVEGFGPLGPFQDYIGRFVAARQLSGHPVAVFIRCQLVWDYEEEERESASSCMHPTLASSIGRETDKSGMRSEVKSRTKMARVSYLGRRVLSDGLIRPGRRL